MSTLDLHNEIERFREKLLDLSLRNPLLNYRKSTRKTLQVVDELPDVMYEHLVDNGKAFVIDWKAEKAEDQEQSSGAESTDAINEADTSGEQSFDATDESSQSSAQIKQAIPNKPLELPSLTEKGEENSDHLFDDRLQTNLTEQKLGSTLRSISREAKTAMEETGINYLFLAIGFLSWRESETSDKERLAPLILIPVRVDKTHGGSGEPRFSVVWDEDDIQSNLSLQKKLDRDFDLKLPAFDPGSKPESYFSSIRESISSKSDWKVKREALLGFFSFHKLSMYADIDPENWNLSEEGEATKIIEEMVCGVSQGDAPTYDSSLYAADYEVDSNPQVDRMRLPLDADSSQQSALIDIRNGKNLVIEGPPGTGKSQTITNAIADAISSGKSVLFVAEKLAALQVVRDRMSRIGLGDFCLELHSDSASPRQVFDSLRKRLACSFDSPQELESVRRALNNRREQLNSYVAAISSTAGPYGKPLYDVLWEIIELRNCGASLHEEAIERMPSDREDYEHSINALNAFSNVLRDVVAPKDSAWWGFWLDPYAFRKSGELEKALDEMKRSSQLYRDSLEKLVDYWQTDPKSTTDLAFALSVVGIRELITHTPTKCDLTEQLADAAVAQESKELIAAMETLAQDQEAFERRFGMTYAEASDHSNSIQDVLHAMDWSSGASTNGIEDAITWLSDLHQVSKDLETVSLTLAKLGLEANDVSTDFLRCINVVRLLRHSVVRDANAVTEAMFDSRGKSVIQDAYHQHQRIQSDRRSVDEQLDNFLAGTSVRLPETPSDVKTLSTSIQELIAHSSTESTLADLMSQSRWRKQASALLEQLVEIAGAIACPGLSLARTYDEFVRSVRLVELALDPRVLGQDTITEEMFVSDGRRFRVVAKEKSNQIASRRDSLAKSFHLPSVPDAEEVKLLSKSLRKYRKSSLRRFSKEYRQAKAKLEEFVAIGTNLSLDQWIKALEDLDAVSSEEEQFNSDAYSIRVLGSGFAGIETDWEVIESRFSWADEMCNLGFDYESAIAIVEHFRVNTLCITMQDIRSAMVHFQTQFLDESQALPDSLLNATTTPFERMMADIQHLETSTSALVSTINESQIDHDWTLAKIASLLQLIEARFMVDARMEEYGQRTDFKEILGEEFRGDSTDWDRLKRVFDWVHTVKKHQIDGKLAKHLLSIRDNEAAHIDTALLTEELDNLKLKATQVPSSIRKHEVKLYLSPTEFRLELENTIRILEAGLVAAGEQASLLSELAERNHLASELISLSQSIESAQSWNAVRNAGIFEIVKNDPGRVKEICHWGEAIRQAFSPIPPHFAQQVIAEANAERLEEVCVLIDGLTETRGQAKRNRELLANYGKSDPGWLVVSDSSMLSGSVEAKIEKLQSEQRDMEQWATFCRAREQCKSLSLLSFCELPLLSSVDADNLANSYRLSVLEKAAIAAFEESLALKSMSGRHLDEYRQEFQAFDRQLSDLQKAEIASQASKRAIPAGNSRGRVGELTQQALIRHETQKQQRHCRIRDLISRAGDAVKGLKPCFMMSPLSVARFIPENSIEFDLVIMDEASQIKPEDAIGTLLRAKQIVVVGDPKQLPPTSFFDKLADEVDEEMSTQFDNTESVLEAAMKIFQPFRRLRWHYRSQHESLIHFSNSRFYDEDLIVFPSPSSDASNFGVSSLYVEDAVFSAGVNLKEAEFVVDQIIRHAMVSPDSSLGVGTFNKKQSEVIAELLEKRCEAEPEVALAVGKLRDLDEGLFIKNLENLQGDERDVIFVCYTYGRDAASGRLFQRFGPINSGMGWRRLNVLVTRSRKRMVVIHSIHPSEIQGGPDKSDGLNAFKAFLEYAVTGTLAEDGAITGRQPDSDFELAVGRRIAEMGLEAVPQVGVAGYFVDIGVRRRDGDRSFVLGVECDGATYHSAKSARDRDRLREEVIKARGWKLHRIWSTDWFLNQATEVEKLKKAIMAATGE